MSIQTLSYTFYSNYLTHHQLPFCLEMNRLLGDKFRFVATDPIHQERLAMGYADMNNDYQFVIRSYENSKSLSEATQLGDKSDVVIIGSAPDGFVQKRILENKLTFRYSERIFKKGRWRILDPRIIRALYLNHSRYHNKNLYMLCASAFTAGDFAMAGAYRNKCFKWGYFPEVREYDLQELMASKKGPRLSILWAGRFLNWKHPEKALYVAKYLRDRGIDFTLKIIGGGDIEQELKSIANTYSLNGCVDFLGYLSPDAVREEMEKAEIYLFTSDYNEGWGAVLNEAMNSACAVVCSNAIGAAPFLIKHGENGIAYRNNNINNLCEKVLTLSKEQELRSSLGISAYKTVHEQWNAKHAVARLLKLSYEILKGHDTEKLFITGPCSVASTEY
jgi:glycosyltransferase involved in cell wall biosynthesis